VTVFTIKADNSRVMTPQRTLAAVLLLFALVINLLAAPGTNISGSILFNGIPRTFILHLPPAGNHWPLVINMHAAGSTPEAQQQYTNFDSIADTAHFLVVYPKALNMRWDPNDREMPFVAALIDTLVARYSIDTTRIYATGFSSGGCMAHYLGCYLGNRLAAIASVDGFLQINYDTLTVVPVRPISILQIHGTQDTAIPYWASSERTIPFWVSKNSCVKISADTFPSQSRIIGRDHYLSADSKTEVDFYTIFGGIHEWPENTANLSDFPVSHIIWEFFSRHSKPEALAATHELKQPIAITPHLSKGADFIEINLHDNAVSLKLYSIRGEEIGVPNSINGRSVRFSTRKLASGVYVVHLIGERSRVVFQFCR
jgi:polyhydroxybutyrate depolymerase